jgi:hypothetical protein
MPLGYTVPTYSGGNLNVVRRWKTLTDKINGDRKIPAAELEADLKFIREKRELGSFTSAEVMPYEFHGIMPGGSMGFTPVFSGFPAALERAKAELASDDLYLLRIVGGGLKIAQSFEFEAGSGERVIIAYHPNSGIAIVDPEREREARREVVNSKISSIYSLRLSGQVYRNIKRWEDIDVAIPDEVAAEEFAVAIEYESPKEEGYPSEYDELFDRFRAITSEEALMLVSARGSPPGKGWVGKPILEPIVIKSSNGEVCHYWLMGYKGDDTNVRNVAENAIAMLNADDGFNPYEFLKLWEILKTYSREFSNFYVDAWTWKTGIGGTGGGDLPGFLYYFKSYLYFAEALYSEGNILNTKILLTGIEPYGWLYAFDVRNLGKRYIYDYPDGSEGGRNRAEIDKYGIREVALGRMARLYDHYKTTPDHYDEAEANWAETLEFIKKHAVKKDGYYRLQHQMEEY